MAHILHDWEKSALCNNIRDLHAIADDLAKYRLIEAETLKIVAKNLYDLVDAGIIDRGNTEGYRMRNEIRETEDLYFFLRYCMDEYVYSLTGKVLDYNFVHKVSVDLAKQVYLEILKLDTQQ